MTTYLLLTKTENTMGFLIIGSLWFWVLFAVASILIIFFLEKALNDEYHDTGGGFPSTIVIIGALTLYYFFGSKQDIYDLGNYLKDHPWMSLLRIGMFVVVGIIWAFAKWYFFLQNKKEYFKKQKENYSDYVFKESDIPQAKRNKSRIISWMSYWPFSMLWTLFDEPVKKIFRYIYTKIESTFQKMSNSTFKDFNAELNESTKEKKK